MTKEEGPRRLLISWKDVAAWSGHSFEMLHARLSAEGKVKSVADQGYFQDLRDRIRFWGTSGWSARPD